MKKRVSKLEYEYDELFENNKEKDIAESFRIYKYLLFVSAGCCLVMTVLSCFVKEYSSFLWFYLGLTALLCASGFVISRSSDYVQKNHMVFYIYNLFLVVVLALKSILLSQDALDMEILVGLFFFPIFIPNSYRGIVLYDFLLAFVYIGCIVPNKDSSVVIVEVANVVIFALLGCAMGILIQRIRLQNIDLSRRLAIQRSTDQLTGLLNRRRLFDDYENRFSAGIAAVAMLDIDFYKKYNDTYGHLTGDKCLKEIGDKLNEFGLLNKIRFYRYGGEEFIGVVHTGGHNDLTLLMNSLNKEIEDLQIEHSSYELGHVTVSIGYCRVNQAVEFDLEQIIECADEALYKAKSTGRNKAVEYTE